MQVSRDVAASSDRVWMVLTDLDRTPEVLSNVTGLERLDGGESFGVGTRWRETRRVFGKEATEEMEVTSVTAGRAYTVEARSGPTHYTSVLRVEPLGGQRARLSMSFDATSTSATGRMLAATVGRLFAGSTRKMLQRDLDEIAAAAEAPAD